MNKRSTLIIGAAALSGAIAIAVIVKKRVLRGSGNSVTQKRTVDSFNGVSLGNVPGLVYVEQAEQAGVEVVADDNLADFVQTTVADGTLFIKLDSGGKLAMPRTPVEVHVAASQIDHLRVDGKGKLRFKAIQAGELTIDVNGMGDVKGGPITAQKIKLEINGIGDCELSGSSVDQDVRVNGIGKYRAAGLDTQKAYVEVSGIGDVELQVKEELTVELNGKCKVRYHGNPKVTSNIARPGVVVQVPEPEHAAATATQAGELATPAM